MHMVSNTVFGMPRHSTPAHSSSLLEQTIYIRTDKLGAFKIFFLAEIIIFFFCSAMQIPIKSCYRDHLALQRSYDEP